MLDQISLKAFCMRMMKSGLALSLVLASSLFGEPAASDDVDAMLEEIREEHGLPALGGLVIVDGEVKAVGAVGLRKFKGRKEVTTEDKWHIGSCTKSMTATLAATFVEEGRLKWDSTVGDVLGRKVKMRDDYKEVTLKMLLTHRGGLPRDASLPALIKARADSGKRDIAKRRKQFAEAALEMKPTSEPGTQYEYSNLGFVVAGVMLETVGGKSWEELMQERVFEPLGMKSAGFGGAASRGKEDQPWGHRNKKTPQPPGPGDDNPDVVGPAGTVHCSLPDLARYVQMHLNHETGSVLEKKATFEILQTIAEGNDDYACGWVVTERPWANGPAIFHNGSNTMNYCVIWMAPARKFATIAVTNIGVNENAPEPCDAAVTGLMEIFLEGEEARASDKVSPFSAVRWEGDQPVVQVRGDWFKLVSLDGIAVGDITKFSQKANGERWKQRFSEDLVELLEGMDHELGASVDLVVQALGSSEEQTLKGVRMTEANREAIRDARLEAERE